MGQLALDALRQEIDEIVPRGPAGDEANPSAHLSRRYSRRRQDCRPVRTGTEVIRKGKAAKPTEFGKIINLQEAENQIVIEYQVYDRRPNDCDLLVPAIETHQATFGRARTQLSTPPRTRPQRVPKASSACAFQIAQPRAPDANASRRVGSATARNGAPAASGASASSSGGMVSAAADIGGTSA
jgi:hypothetical protein